MSKIRRNLYKAARILGDIEAAKKGKVGQRIGRRITGKMAGKGLKASTSGCFIATAIYGTPVAKEIKDLCKFRDRILLKDPLGRGFVKFYYATPRQLLILLGINLS